MTIPAGLPKQVAIRDVGPRDGLQPEEPVPLADRIRLIEALADAGLPAIEVAAFVSPKAVPAMAGAADVVAGVPARPGLVRAALVPNAKGASLAVEAGVEELTVTISASETYNQRNVHMTTQESEAAIAEIIAIAGTGGIPVDVVISCAFGSPYEGEIAPVEIADLAARILDGGVDQVTLADTTGMATPRRIHEVIEAVRGTGIPIDTTGLHLHDTRGTALVNAYAALEHGIARFDTSVGGLGGSPFAHGAGGNLATETLVAMLDDLGITTGIAIEPLIEAAALIEALVGRPVPSGVAHHGPRSRPPRA
ncbi:hydroxymethylglutaryl-CoA lyase [Aquihabitans daechungensis]|uniref:hydroxymethylglutaryl-CoA lyase n=1 Tax=Aquihabitans daechungensis TaxID=1052257 RepID=UPI003BA1E2DA